MQVLMYDNSFAGLLTAIFDAYDRRYAEARIVTLQQTQQNIFGGVQEVYTDEAKALRVWTGLKKRLSGNALKQLYYAFLSEQDERGDMALSYVRHAFSKNENIETDYAHPAVRYIIDTAKRVHREKHRMEAFVRFQHTRDDIYYATVAPDFDVLPLLAEHFGKRYADQRWLIYDVKRTYGLYYDLVEVQFVHISFTEQGRHATNETDILSEDEPFYQQLWRTYFNSVNIPARKNLKLHIQHMPRRYWKYLTEKQSGTA